MKYRIVYILAIIPVLFGSCEKYLESDSPSRYTDTYIFSHLEDAQKIVNSIYQCFQEDAYTTRLSLNPNCNTDVEVGIASSAPDGGRRDIWTFECTPTNSDILVPWNNAYLAINRANECIEGISNSPLKEDPKMIQLLGEAITLRAYWYFELVRNWGDVPFKITPTRAGDEFYLPRTDRDTILTHVIQDMIIIEPYMKWADQLDYGIEQVSREFAQGLIARLALARGGYSLRPDLTMQRSSDYLDYYQIANTYCLKVIESQRHRLTDNFGTIFLNENTFIVANNGDMLFEVAYSPNRGEVGYWIGVRMEAGGTHPYGSASSAFTFPPTYYYSFDSLDTRLPVTCVLYYYDADLQQQIVNFNSIAVGKWSKRLYPNGMGTSSTKGTGINWPVMRYSDILLMYAETENELNGSPTQAAKDALALVRKRAFNASDWPDKVTHYIDSISTDHDAFFNAIVNERAWEFGGEMIRKYDLIRWNLYGEKIAETKNTLTQMGIDANYGTGEFAGYPADIFYKVDSLNVFSVFGQYRKPAVEPPIINYPNVGDNPDGYTRKAWLTELYDTTTLSPHTYIEYEWRGYTDNSGILPVRYILPVHSSIVSSSLGVLRNDGYGYSD